MIKSSWFYVKFKHAEKVSAASAAALPRALLGLSCSPPLKCHRDLVFQIKLCPWKCC